MSIKLFCLLKGNTPAVKHAFEVVIEGDKSVSALKKAIKAEKHLTFRDVEADEIKLWKVEIPDDHDSELADPALQVELLPTTKNFGILSFHASREMYSCHSRTTHAYW